MLDEEFRAGAWSLIVGSLLTILVFAFHPSHIDPRPLIGPFTLSQIVHGTAIIAAPLILFGMLEMARWISFGDWRVRLGLIVAMFAMVLTVAAAVVSNFVTPAAVRASHPGLMPMGHGAQAGHAGGVMQMPPLVQLSVALNRGLAQVHVALLSIAIILLGTALFRRNRTLAVAGMIVGTFPLAWQLSGRFSPETNTMPVIVFAQSAWLIAAAWRMMSRPEKASA